MRTFVRLLAQHVNELWPCEFREIYWVEIDFLTTAELHPKRSTQGSGRVRNGQINRFVIITNKNISLLRVVWYRLTTGTVDVSRDLKAL